MPASARTKRLRQLLPAVVAAFLLVLLAAGWGYGPTDRIEPASGAALARAAGPIEPRIVGGTAVPNGTYRFMAYLKIGPYLCGGSLIDATHILTAAHCVDGQTAGSITAYIGGTTVSGGIPTGSLTRSASSVTMHPSYNSSNEMNDAAVITLSQAVPSAANGGIDPIGFVASGSAQGLAEGQMLTVAGWGTTSYGGAVSGTLLEVSVPAQTDAYCKQRYGLSNAESAVMFCAGPKAGGQDSCQGDSGGPLFYLDNGIYTQVGIVSWGNDCAAAGYPGVYSRIAAASINTFIAGFVPSLPPPTATPIPTPTSTPIPTQTPIPTAAPTDTTPPSVTITAPRTGSTVGSPVTVKVNAADGQSGIAGVELRRCKGGACASAGIDQAAPWTFKVKLKPGKHDLVAVATDQAGNSQQSGTVTVTVPKPGKKSAAAAKTAAGDPDRNRDEARGRDRSGKAGSRD